MNFIHGYLLVGLLLAGVPILLHLIMRQKPRRLAFPAFRFLKARQRTNQRKLRLQHLLLLALRVLVLAALCLALARPRLFASRFVVTPDRPIVAVLLFDTSASMEYTVGGRTRLDEARQRARELLDEMDPASQVAVLDSGDDAQEVLLPLAEARARLEALRIRPAAGALNRGVERALAMLRQEETSDETPPRFLYVFSDRTRASWDPAGVKPLIPDGVVALFVDVGTDQPRDLAIEQVEVLPAVVPPGGRYEVRVRIRGTPGGHESELSCQIDNDPEADRAAERRPVQLSKEQTGEVIVFERTAPTPPAGTTVDIPYQVTVRLGARDALPFNNTRHATFLVRGGRRLLTLVEGDRRKARVWQAVHEATRSFTPELRTLDEADRLTAGELSAYAVIALFQVSNVPEAWADKLTTYVQGGGGLAIVPGGDEVLPEKEAFHTHLRGLLPAALDKLASTPPGKPLVWEPFRGGHPLMVPFVQWVRGVDPDFAREELRPFVRRYWQLGPLARDSLSIARYADPERSPALAERALGRGKVVLFTSPLDIRLLEPNRSGSPQWNNYWQDSSFGLVLVDRVCRYLGGEVSTPELNFRCGETPQVPVSAAAVLPLAVHGPGLAGAEQTVRAGPDRTVAVPQATTPGNYQIVDGRNHTLSAFSLDVPWSESNLDSVPAEELESVFGSQGVVKPGGALSLRDALAAGRPPPIELLPYLMLLVLLVLTVESVLSNRFYRRTREAGPDASAAELT